MMETKGPPHHHVRAAKLLQGRLARTQPGLNFNLPIFITLFKCPFG